MNRVLWLACFSCAFFAGVAVGYQAWSAVAVLLISAVIWGGYAVLGRHVFGRRR